MTSAVEGEEKRYLEETGLNFPLTREDVERKLSQKLRGATYSRQETRMPRWAKKNNGILERPRGQPTIRVVLPRSGVEFYWLHDARCPPGKMVSFDR